MKSFILAVNMLVYFGSFANSPTSFLPIGVDEALNLSHSLDKNIFVYYYDDDCIFCSVADDSLFANQEVREVLAQRYISVKANYRNSIYTSWYEKYKVTCLPTMQIISPEGALLHEIKGVNSPAEFLDILSKFKELPLAENEVEDTASTSDSPINERILKNNPDQVDAGLSTSTDDAFFTIQLGAFKVFDNVVKFRRVLEEKLNTSLSIYESNEDGLFRIFSYQHESRSGVLNNLDKVKEEGVDYWLRRVEPSLKVFKLEVQ